MLHHCCRTIVHTILRTIYLWYCKTCVCVSLKINEARDNPFIFYPVVATNLYTINANSEILKITKRMYQEERTRHFRLVNDYLIKPLTITLFGTWIFMVVFKWSCLTLAHAMSVIALKDRGSQIAKSASDFRFNRTLHLANPSLRISKFIPCSFVAAISLCSRS